MNLAIDSWMLGLDAATVVGLRLAKLSVGDAAAAVEAQRMIGEKVEAAIELQMLALTGELGTTMHSAAARSVKHYGRAVRANRRRLSKPQKRG